MLQLINWMEIEKRNFQGRMLKTTTLRWTIKKYIFEFASGDRISIGSCVTEFASAQFEGLHYQSLRGCPESSALGSRVVWWSFHRNLRFAVSSRPLKFQKFLFKIDPQKDLLKPKRNRDVQRLYIQKSLPKAFFKFGSQKCGLPFSHLYFLYAKTQVQPVEKTWCLTWSIRHPSGEPYASQVLTLGKGWVFEDEAKYLSMDFEFGKNLAYMFGCVTLLVD